MVSLSFAKHSLSTQHLREHKTMAEKNLLLLGEKLKDIIDHGVVMSIKSTADLYNSRINKMEEEVAAVEEYYSPQQRPRQLSALAEFGQGVMAKGAVHKTASIPVSMNPIIMDIMREQIFTAMREFTRSRNIYKEEVASFDDADSDDEETADTHGDGGGRQ